jgi:hypothetical protein
MVFLEADVQPNEKDQLLKDLKEADYWIRPSMHQKIYVEKFDPSGFGWVKFTGTEKNEWFGGMCILAMFHGCYAPVRITDSNLGEELNDLRSLILKTKFLLEKYPDRFSVKMALLNLEGPEKELMKRHECNVFNTV